ncbi:hypothetical protein FisN_30Lh019 [Fistulifera solaris]|uniref:Large subunit ribosomal protein L34 n=1 Tax=Fistulifera solaris TaxID=1519565 RepID=A0A1Z5JIA8_FISSO|nr:hypothetical protein FisN_30Lh019 [Fistulifera solaris]|eukprot:GAX13735.1 hypothetical protein FisN_30Lh019 [Fistulifera solaris]
MSLLLQTTFRNTLLTARWMPSMSQVMIPTNTSKLMAALPPWRNVLLDVAIWFGKRTFQPSIVRKKRQTGFLVRQRTVGGRRVLQRRQAKGRMRLGGGI